MAFDSSYYKSISLKVKALLYESNVIEPPVDIRKMAIACGAKVIPYELGDEVSGILFVDQNQGTIGYNTSNLRVRQRFTIAHELGHLLLHVNLNSSASELFVDKDFIVKFRSEKQYTNKELRQEREANTFAAAILMPQEMVYAEVKKLKYQDLNEHRLIEELAKVFDVSVPAMTYRFSDLNIYHF